MVSLSNYFHLMLMVLCFWGLSPSLPLPHLITVMIYFFVWRRCMRLYLGYQNIFATSIWKPDFFFLKHWLFNGDHASASSLTGLFFLSFLTASVRLSIPLCEYLSIQLIDGYLFHLLSLVCHH